MLTEPVVGLLVPTSELTSAMYVIARVSDALAVANAVSVTVMQLPKPPLVLTCRALRDTQLVPATADLPTCALLDLLPAALLPKSVTLKDP